MRGRRFVRPIIMTSTSFIVTLFCISLVFVLTHRNLFREKIEQSASATLMLQVYHFMIPPLEGTNKISYSLFDSKSAWKIEDDQTRERLPPYDTIKGLDVKNMNSNFNAPTPKFDRWERSGADSYSSKYSELNQINIKNVKELQLAWTYHSKEPTWRGNVETNPIVAGGNIFVTTPADFLVSINAANGTENWRTEMRTPARRGLLWWPGNATHSPRLFVPSADGVYAIDPANGGFISDFGTNGRVGINTSLVAPAVDGNRLIIATMAPSVEAYDVESGKPIWKTSLHESHESSVVPSDNTRPFTLEAGNPWSGFSLDGARSRVYVSTGNAGPILYGPYRPGRNNYSNSVVCIDSVSGKIEWSFQEVAHDLWDFDVTSPPILVTVRKENKLIDAVAVATKIGNTLLLDRDSGAPLYDFRLRRAPTSSVPGEETWPYQPDVETPERFATSTFSPSDITDIDGGATANVESKLKNAQYGFFVPPAINGVIATYGVHGGAEWPGAAVDQATGTLYVPSNHDPWTIRLFYSERAPNPVRSADKAGDYIYQDKCSKCHGVRREGYFEREVLGNKGEGDTRIAGDTAYPSLIGITASRNIQGTKWFYDAHDGVALEKAVSGLDIEILDKYLSAADHFSDDRRSFEVSYVWQVLLDGEGHPGSKPPWGKITAIDLNSGKRMWSVPFGEYKDLTDLGIPITGQPNFGGLIVTKGGLVFATGTIDQKIRAFDSSSGVELWNYALPAAGSAPPMTYELNGTQYLVVVASGGIFAGFKDHSDAILAFRLGKVPAH